MKIRCPYCKAILNKPSSLCPSCGKMMTIPDNIANRTARQRHMAKDQIAREAERRHASIQAGLDASFLASKPSRMIFAVGILVIAGGLLLVKLFSGTNSTFTPSTHREERAQRELDVLDTALDIFYKKYDRYPSTDEGLKALVMNPGLTNWDKHIVTVIHPDPWKKPYCYRCDANGYALFSSGRDRIIGNEDDIYPSISLSVEDEPETSAVTESTIEEHAEN